MTSVSFVPFPIPEEFTLPQREAWVTLKKDQEISYTHKFILALPSLLQNVAWKVNQWMISNPRAILLFVYIPSLFTVSKIWHIIPWTAGGIVTGAVINQLSEFPGVNKLAAVLKTLHGDDRLWIAIALTIVSLVVQFPLCCVCGGVVLYFSLGFQPPKASEESQERYGRHQLKGYFQKLSKEVVRLADEFRFNRKMASEAVFQQAKNFYQTILQPTITVTEFTEVKNTFAVYLEAYLVSIEQKNEYSFLFKTSVGDECNSLHQLCKKAEERAGALDIDKSYFFKPKIMTAFTEHSLHTDFPNVHSEMGPIAALKSDIKFERIGYRTVEGQWKWDLSYLKLIFGKEAEKDLSDWSSLQSVPFPLTSGFKKVPPQDHQETAIFEVHNRTRDRVVVGVLETKREGMGWQEDRVFYLKPGQSTKYEVVNDKLTNVQGAGLRMHEYKILGSRI